MINIKHGNIFTTECQTIVNTINCIGVMGAGIAYEFRLRHPEMFIEYKNYCNQGLIDIGKLWIYNVPEPTSYKKILNFPTKRHWKHPSKIEYLELGLQKFLDTYKLKNITSIAFPLLGADKGGISKNISLNIMQQYLNKIDIEVEIWHFDHTSKDDLFDDFKSKFLTLDETIIKEQSKLRIDVIRKIKNALYNNDINSLSGLLSVKGIGNMSLEKSFNFIKSFQKNNHNLFT